MRARLTIAAAFAAALTGGADARATLLDQPPKLYTFKLDDPAVSLPLLRAFHDAEIERPGPVRNYSIGPWGRWRTHPWWSLAWQPTTSIATGSASPLIDSMTPASSFPEVNERPADQ